MSSNQSPLYKRQRSLAYEHSVSSGASGAFASISQRPMTYKLPSFSYASSFAHPPAPAPAHPAPGAPPVPVPGPSFDPAGYVPVYLAHVPPYLAHAPPYSAHAPPYSAHAPPYSAHAGPELYHGVHYGYDTRPYVVEHARPVPDRSSEPNPPAPTRPSMSSDYPSHPSPSHGVTDAAGRQPLYLPPIQSLAGSPYTYAVNHPSSYEPYPETRPSSSQRPPREENPPGQALPPSKVPPASHSAFQVPRIKSPKHSVPSHDASALSKKSSKRKHPQAFEDAFVKFIPMLQNVSISNFGGFLVEVLKDCHANVPLDDLYNLLYNSESASSKQKSEALDLCQMVIDTFKNPAAAKHSFQVKPFRNSSISSVSFHELLRTFLAIKIIFSSLREVDDSPLDSTKGQPNLPRMSIYKVYYIICQRLIHKHPNISSSLSDQQSIIVGQSKFGKLTKLVFPHLVAKRLGSRGHSKYHYIDVEWNHSMIGEDILGLLDLEITELRDHFDGPRDRRDVGQRPSGPGSILNTTTLANPALANPKSTTRALLNPAISETIISPVQPNLYTYVDLSSIYPKSNCSPRSWETAPNSLPQSSEWAQAIMDKSLSVLNRHNVHFESLIENIKTGRFSEKDPGNLSTSVPQALKVLSDASSPSDAYLHVYLVVLLLVLPVMLSSDQEIPPASKMQLRICANKCIAELDSEAGRLPNVDDISLRNFTRVLRKIVHINELSSIKVNFAYRDGVLKKMVRDLEFLGNLDGSTPATELPPLEDILVRATVMAFNAYSYELIDVNPVTKQRNPTGPVLNIAKSITKAVVMSTDPLLEFASSLNRDKMDRVAADLPLQVFRLSIQLFHSVTLSFPAISQLPIPIITYIMSYMQSEMQKASYPDRDTCDPELGAETLRTWWIFSTMFQEYMGVISEVAGLSESLARVSL
ncbi:hypothetical protein JCM33374_g906 [Metschnikowia sp. JCM 33374]|nr:hypothetical protein JCM33374_g906 [Metschnikowia sp. JCM 33374]